MVLGQDSYDANTATLKHALTDFACHFLARIDIDNEWPSKIL